MKRLCTIIGEASTHTTDKISFLDLPLHPEIPAVATV